MAKNSNTTFCQWNLHDDGLPFSKLSSSYMGSHFRSFIVLIRTISCLVCEKVIGPTTARPQPDHSPTVCYAHAKWPSAMQTHVPSRISTREWAVRPNLPNPPPVYRPGWTYSFVWSAYCCFCCAHHRIVAAFLFVTLVTRLCAGCIIMSHVPHVKFSHTLTDSAVLVPFSRMPHPPHFNPVPLPNRGNLPGRKEHLLHKVGQLPLVGYPHNHQRSFVSKVGKGEIQQLVWGEPPVSCEFVYVSVFRKLVTTPAVIYVNSAKY